MAGLTVQDDSIPRLAPGVKLRFDKVRQSWALLAPERLLLPDEQALAILQLVDGARSLAAIADILAERYDAPRDLLLADAASMLSDLAGKGMVRP